jgi:hypothetical protein
VIIPYYLFVPSTSIGMASDQSLEDAMVVIQEASAAIAQVSTKLNNLQTDNEDVVAALKGLTDKVSQLESNQNIRAIPKLTAKPPLFIRLSFGLFPPLPQLTINTLTELGEGCVQGFFTL